MHNKSSTIEKKRVKFDIERETGRDGNYDRKSELLGSAGVTGCWKARIFVREFCKGVRHCPFSTSGSGRLVEGSGFTSHPTGRRLMLSLFTGQVSKRCQRRDSSFRGKYSGRIYVPDRASKKRTPLQRLTIQLLVHRPLAFHMTTLGIFFGNPAISSINIWRFTQSASDNFVEARCSKRLR